MEDDTNLIPVDNTAKKRKPFEPLKEWKRPDLPSVPASADTRWSRDHFDIYDPGYHPPFPVDDTLKDPDYRDEEESALHKTVESKPEVGDGSPKKCARRLKVKGLQDDSQKVQMTTMRRICECRDPREPEMRTFLAMEYDTCPDVKEVLLNLTDILRGTGYVVEDKHLSAHQI